MNTDRWGSDRWDPDAARQFVDMLGPIAKLWFRSEVRGLESFPISGGALVMGNHSGGMMTPDVLIFAAAFYRELGYGRPLYTLGHDMLFVGPLSEWLTRIGLIRADRDTAAQALRSGGVVLVFPGGVYDAYRPTRAEKCHRLQRAHRVHQGSDASRCLDRSDRLDRRTRESVVLDARDMARETPRPQAFSFRYLPVSIGFPFGLSMVVPPNVPLPTKIVVQVLEPIDVVARFGEDPNIDDVDSHVRSTMQTALDGLVRERRFPVLG